MTRKSYLLAAAFVLATGVAAHAATFDSLECYEVKDTRTFAALSRVDMSPRDLVRFGIERGCKLAGPKATKHICTPTDTTPAGSVLGRKLNRDYLCYQLKCRPLTVNTSAAVADRFGAGAVTVKKKSSKRLLCVPMPIVTP